MKVLKLCPTVLENEDESRTDQKIKILN